MKTIDTDKILEELKEAKSTLVIDFNNSSFTDQIKYKICSEFVRYAREEKVDKLKLSRVIDVDEEVVEKIFLHYIDSFSLDLLLDYLSKLNKYITVGRIKP